VKINDQSFEVAEAIAQFVLSEADGERMLIVRSRLRELARKIRTADWIPADAEAECTSCETRRRSGLSGQCPACANERSRNVRQGGAR
jgi:hypothetical protein